MKKITIITTIALLGFLFINSCTEDWEEMNVDPDNPTVAPATNILAHTLRYAGDVFYDDWQDMNNFMSFAGHVTKIQYVDEARYEYRESVVNAAWEDYYVLQMDLKKMASSARSQGRMKTWAVSKTFSAFLWQMATDMWKSIPYEEALAGEEGVNNPVYSDQETIYLALIDSLQAANDEFNKAYPSDDLGSGDVLYQADFSKWQKFCNSLRLRIALRLSYSHPTVAQNLAEAVLGDPANNPIFESNEDNAFMYWPGAAPYKEPWAENFEDRDDHGMAKTLVDTLQALNDPRLPVYAKENPDGEYVGLVEGAAKGTFNISEISRIGVFYRENPTGHTPFMRYSETMFNVAEAALNGWNVGADAQTAYETALRASLEENQVAEADITTYMGHPRVAWGGTEEENLHKIIKQKWIALFKQGREAWSLQRRTDFPQMDDAPGSPFTGHNRQPFRYPYPQDEKILNETNYMQAADGIVDNYWGQQMIWDTRTGVE
jgi:hypothetical protein